MKLNQCRCNDLYSCSIFYIFTFLFLVEFIYEESLALASSQSACRYYAGIFSSVVQALVLSVALRLKPGYVGTTLGAILAHWPSWVNTMPNVFPTFTNEKNMITRKFLWLHNSDYRNDIFSPIAHHCKSFQWSFLTFLQIFSCTNKFQCICYYIGWYVNLRP